MSQINAYAAMLAHGVEGRIPIACVVSRDQADGRAIGDPGGGIAPWPPVWVKSTRLSCGYWARGGSPILPSEAR